MIRLDEVSFSVRAGFWLKKRVVLKNVSFEVRRGEIVALLGSNGAGKTSLIQLLTHVRKPESGKISLAGSLGYLPERPYLYEHYSARELLHYLGTLSGIGRVELRSRVQEVLSTVGLSDAADRSLKGYSKGMLQRVGLAQSFLHLPDLLILDEPMSGLDAETRHDLQRLILGYAEKGGTVFFTSHSFSDVEVLAERLLYLEKGKLVSEFQRRNGEFHETQSGAPAWVRKEFAISHTSPDSFLEGVQRYLGQHSEGLRMREVPLVRREEIRLVLESNQGFQQWIESVLTLGARIESIQSLGLVQREWRNQSGSAE
jgi:ABC-2 type transport system ATP-binding protein